ncbi:hypothetical protein EST62_03555 [Chlorobaculum sp. 24CR]|uniref:DUF5677 domain-containing protein n=1 Tax=Chlorobaculum sp. 24CR TaxID=2508878 RepID=UPI00100B3F66|nr:DUF5677 domain-containing protein [Chlorobaculum sp. 24CR]RXK88304.1 hypothetical protein EST62_03555 [Chlorobaculum sp. 24CR]
MLSQNPKLKEIVAKKEEIYSFTSTVSHECFLKEEVLRFISIAGTIANSFPNVATSIDERILSHIMLRSVIENYIKIRYIFHDSSKTANRFDEILNSFRDEYSKLFNDIHSAYRSEIETPIIGWKTRPKAPNLKDMLSIIKDDLGESLDKSYFIYRIGSFDTHGNSLNALFNAVFDKDCNFPYLEIFSIIEHIADYYLSLFKRYSI